MGKSAKDFLKSIILFSILLAVPQAAHAAVARDAFRNDSFSVGIGQTGRPDSTLVPGGITKFYLNTVGAFGVEGQSIGDSFVVLTVFFSKPPSTVLPFSSIVDTVQLFLDNDSNGVLNGPSEATLIQSSSAPSTAGADTARYVLSGFIRRTGSAAESYVLVVNTKYNLGLADSSFTVRLESQPVGANAGVQFQTGNFSFVNVPTTEIIFPTFQFKVFGDSTGRVFQGNYFRHQDSSVSAPGFTILQGTFQGETRTVAGDSLAKFGVAFGGTAGANVDSAWLLVGSGNTRVDLARTTGTHWAANNISTVALAVLGGLDTFRVVVTVDTPPLQSTLGCTIPIDSIATKFRRSNTSIIDSSGIVLFTRPRLVVGDSPLSSIGVHPDTRVTDSFLIMAGTINTDTLLSPVLPMDSLSAFTFRLILTGGMTNAHINETTSQIVIGNTVWTPVRLGPDTYGIVAPGLDSAFSQSTYESFRIYIRTESTAPIGATVRAAIQRDSIATRYRVAGPDSDLLGSRTVTINKPRLVVGDSPLTNIGVHPDTRVTDSFLIMAGTINADTLLTPTLPMDSLTAFTFRLIFTGGMTTAHVNETTSRIVIGNTVWTPVRMGPDTYSIVAPGLDSAFSNGTYESFRIYIRTESTAPIGATVRAQILQDSITTRYRVAGPDSALLGSRTVTINKPRLVVGDSPLANIGVHPDTRLTDSFLIMAGTINADTLLTPALPMDSLTAFTFRLIFTGGMTNAHINETTSQIVIGNTVWRPFRLGLDTYSIVAPGLDSAFSNGTYESFRIYIRTESTAPPGATVRAAIQQDSITTRYRVAGPDSDLLSSRTVTIFKPRVALTDSALNSINMHPDSRTQLPVDMINFSINADTLLTPSLGTDTITRLGFGIRFTGGMRYTDVESVGVVLNGETFTAAVLLAAANPDSYQVLPNKAFTGTCVVRIVVALRETAPLGSTLGCTVPIDSITTQFRVAGPSSVLMSNRTITCTAPILQLPVFPANPDTVLPAFGFLAPFVICTGTIRIDSTIIRPDTDRIFRLTIYFVGTARDSMYDVQFSKGVSSSWLSCTKIASDTWTLVLDSTTFTGETFAIRTRIADTVTIGSTFNVFLAERSCTAQFSTAGPGTVRESGPRFLISADPIVLIMDSLGDTTIPPWNALGSNPTLVCSGTIFINIGPVQMLGYDTLTRFGISIDTATAKIRANDTITAVTLVLSPNAARPADTISLIKDSASSPALLWRLAPGADTTIGDSQAFRVFVTVAAGRSPDTVTGRFLTGESYFVRIPKDSVTTRFTSGTAGETSSSRTVNLRYMDTTFIVQSLVFGDTDINPDTRANQNPFVIFAGTIRGETRPGYALDSPAQQFFPAAGDSLTRFAIRVFSATAGEFTADSISSVTMYLGAARRPLVLTRTVFSPAVPLGDKIWHWEASVDSKLLGVNNSDTFEVRAMIMETVPLNSRIRTQIFSDSISTFYQQDSAPSFTILGSRTVTFKKASLGLTMTPLLDTIVSPFRQLNDSVVIMQGKFSSTASPTDSLTSFGIQLFNVAGSTGLRGDSLLVKMAFESGTFTPFSETTLVLDSQGPNPVYRLAGFRTIETGAFFTIRIQPNTALAATETPLQLIGQAIRALIPLDSVSAFFSIGTTGNLSSGDTVFFAYLDTVFISDSALPDINVHPDSRQNQNPFIAYRGFIEGQTSIVNVSDTLQRIAFRFGGTAVRGNDSVAAAWVVLDSGAGPETIALSRVDTNAWGLTLNRSLPFGFMDCTLYVRISETVVLGSNFFATILPDSASTIFTQDTELGGFFRASRTVTFQKNVVTVSLNPIANDSRVHPVRAKSQVPKIILDGTITGDSTSITGDTLTRFSINLTGSAKDSVQNCTIVIGPNRETMALAKTASTALMDTWSIDTNYPFKALDITSDTFVVDILVPENVAQSSVLNAFIPAGGIKTQLTESGPVAVLQGASFVFMRDSIFIYTEPRNPAFSGAIQARETVAIMWFVPQSDVEADTMHDLIVRILGANDPTKIDTLFLVRDANRNRIYDTLPSTLGPNTFPADTIVGYFFSLGADSWKLRINSNGDSQKLMITDTYGQQTVGTRVDTAEYLIVIAFRDTSATSIRAQIPALGADGWYSESGPVTAVSYDSYFLIPRDTNSPLPPIFFTVTTGSGNAFKISWGPSASGDTGMTGGQYNLYWAGSVAPAKDLFPTTLLQATTHVSGQLSYDTILSAAPYGLVDGQTYRFRVTAQDQAGNEGNSSLVITAVFKADTAPVPALQGVIVQPSAGDFVFISNSINLVAQLTVGNPSLVAQCTFLIRPLSGGAYKVIGIANDSIYAGGNYYFSTLFNATDLALVPAADSYEIRAVFATATETDRYASTININLTTRQESATYVSLLGDTSGRVDTAGGTDTASMIIQVSTGSAAELVFLRTPTGAFDMALNLAKGTLNLDTDKLIINGQKNGMTDTQIGIIRSRGVKIPAYWVNIILQSGQTTLRNSSSRITVNYIDKNGDGFDDSTGIDMSKSPRIYTFSAAGALEALDNTVVDLATKTISARVRHFSPFFISNDTGLNTQGLNRLIVGPNPFRPNDGNDQTGRPFTPGDATSGIIFKNLPNQVKIEIYTILGEKVTQINKNDGNATINWSVQNDDGKSVASGYYLYVVTDIVSGQRVTGKVAVIR